jgi:hypothetical protein
VDSKRWKLIEYESIEYQSLIQVGIVIQGKIMDVGDVEFRYMDLLTLDRLLREVKARIGIG